MSLWTRALERIGLRKSAVDLYREFGIPVRNLPVRNIGTMDALGITSVWAAVSVIAQGVAQVPWKVFRETDEGREVARDHPLYDLLKCSPNAHQTSYELRETIVFHRALGGNAYAFVDRVGNAREIRSLTPIEPHRVMFDVRNDVPRYRVRLDNGDMLEIPPENMWHLRGASWNSWSGLATVSLAARALGLAIDTEKAHESLFENGVETSGVLSVAEPLSPENHERLTKYIDSQFQRDKRSRAMILDRGARWNQMTMTGVDAQHIETRKHQIEEIARAFRVQPIMLMQADKAATYASAEQMFIAHVVHTLAPWYESISQSADKHLLSPEERASGLYTKFLPNALMRGAAADRAEFYSRALGAGGSPAWMLPNEVRELEDMNRTDGGDRLFFPPQGEPNADG